MIAIYTTKKVVSLIQPFSLSGYQDSNLGPPAPKAGALTGLRYTPNRFAFLFKSDAKVLLIFDICKVLAVFFHF